MGPSDPAVAPAITTQPTSLTVPIGLEGILHVAVTGNPLNYQWSRNGTVIAGATSNSYTTPTVGASDTGAMYTVTVSNSAGSVISQPATITAGARAPKPGDLRFQQVDSENTINGYGLWTGLQVDVQNAISASAFGVINQGISPCSSATGCELFISAFAQPAGTVPLAAGFMSGPYSNFEADLSTGAFPATSFGGGPATAANTIVNALVLDPANDGYGLSYMQTSQTGGFDLAQHTVDPTQFQAAASQEGQSSRVITAVSYNAGQITYFSYGWIGDATTSYDALASLTPLSGAGTAATSLAAQGYIITAVGYDLTGGTAVLIGTRVHGDTLPRPILVEPSFTAATTQLLSNGYALVGAINNNANGTGITIGER